MGREAGASLPFCVGCSRSCELAGVRDAYLLPYLNGEAARWAPKMAHDAGYEGAEHALMQAQSNEHVSRLSVITRHGEVLYDTDNALEGDVPTPLEALEGGRATLSRTDVEQWHSAQDFINAALYRVPANIGGEIRNGPALRQPVIVLPGVQERPRLHQSRQMQPAPIPSRLSPSRSRGHTL